MELKGKKIAVIGTSNLKSGLINILKYSPAEIVLRGIVCAKTVGEILRDQAKIDIVFFCVDLIVRDTIPSIERLNQGLSPGTKVIVIGTNPFNREDVIRAGADHFMSFNSLTPTKTIREALGKLEL